MVKLGVRSGSEVCMCSMLNSTEFAMDCAMVSVAPEIGLIAVNVPDACSKARSVGSFGPGLLVR